MLLDLPASLLYRRGVNLYRPMRLLCTDYCGLVRVVVGLTALTVSYLAVPRLVHMVAMLRWH